MKKILFTLAVLSAAALTLSAQEVTDAQKAAEQAAEAIADAPVQEAAAPKPKYWNLSLLTNINFSEQVLHNWAAGGFNSVALAANVDANANYAKDKMKWNNRLQMDYGFMYSADKPIIQKTKDRFYLESKWGYATPVRHLDYSANFSFLNQFENNYDYKTPTDEQFAANATETEAWMAARTLKSTSFAPAYITLGVGIDWTPWDWLAVNFSPITGGIVTVTVPELRKTYGMPLWQDGLDETDGKSFRPVRLQFGAQLKIDGKWIINDKFSLTTQLTLFTDYLDKPFVKNRVNWDNKVFWKLAKYFALTFTTNMIYDPNVITPIGTDAVQFKEFLEFGFTYTIASKN
ncbi:MAG: DUF3078 domain-containing protein [Bacteroidales bacterium]|nr:DUF3078 domain-containing protein [Bacteroidales bacterium]